MIMLGLTGSIGMGKSTVAKMFADEGIPVFDADETVHRLQGPGGRLVPEIEKAFPGSTGPQGVDRAKLANMVIGNKAALAVLESIVHPAVAEERNYFLDENRDAPLVVLDIPLLFEKGLSDKVDHIAVVSAPADMQRARVLGRPGMTEDRFRQILSLQLPDEEKRARADFVISTSGTFDATRDQVRKIIACLTKSAVP